MYCIIRLKRKGATPPNRSERVVRDLQSRMMPVHPMPTHSSGTKHRRRRHSSNSSQEHIGNLMSSPNLQARMNKVSEYQLSWRLSIIRGWASQSQIGDGDRSRVDLVTRKCRNLCWTRYAETYTTVKDLRL